MDLEARGLKVCTASTIQPKNGETVLFCIHAAGDDKPDALHWFQFDRPVEFIRHADESKGSATWLSICAHCFANYALGLPLASIPIGGDDIWDGTGPLIIEQEPN